MSQTFTAKLSIDNVHVPELKPGDTIFVPVKLVELSGGRIAGFQLYLEFDHSQLEWIGSYENPLPGIKNIHKNISFNTASWVINDTDKQLAVIWIDPTFRGQEIKANDILFEALFICKSKDVTKLNSKLKMGTVFEEVDGRIVRGVTELYSEIPDSYSLKFIDGGIKNY